jgi:hypothetical protein
MLDIELSNTVHCAEYRAEMDAFDTFDDISTVAGAVRYIEALERKSLSVVKDIKKPPPVRKLFQRWSPKAMILIYYLKFLIRIQRKSQDGFNALTGQLKRRDSLRLCLNRINTICSEHDLEEANKEHHAKQMEAGKHPRRRLLAHKCRQRKLGPDVIDCSVLSIDCEDYSVWDFDSDWMIRAKCEATAIKSKLHYREKTQMRKRIKEHASKNLANFKAGKVRKVLNSLFQRYRGGANTVRL